MEPIKIEDLTLKSSQPLKIPQSKALEIYGVIRNIDTKEAEAELNQYVTMLDEWRSKARSGNGLGLDDMQPEDGKPHRRLVVRREGLCTFAKLFYPKALGLLTFDLARDFGGALVPLTLQQEQDMAKALAADDFDTYGLMLAGARLWHDPYPFSGGASSTEEAAEQYRTQRENMVASTNARRLSWAGRRHSAWTE